MSAPIAKNQFAFELPNLTYVDAHFEEPTLREAAAPVAPPQGFGDWIAARIAGVRTWRENRMAMAEMEMMTDHELLDIGLTRADLPRVFDAQVQRRPGCA